jgi:hypothetical protein
MNTLFGTMSIMGRFLQKAKVIPLEASYWHLLITPFHGGLQKVKGKVDGFTELKENDD